MSRIAWLARLHIRILCVWERTRESTVSTYATSAPALFAADAWADADDEQLARRADTRSFSVLYERYLPAVFRYVSGKVSSPEEAEDLTSEAFRQAWTSRRAYRARGTYRAWLFSIVRRSVADHYRRHRPAAALETTVVDRLQDSAPGPEEEILREDQSRTARALLAELSHEQREVLSLRFAAELTYAEIAVVIGKREEAVKKIAQRALEAIRRRQTYVESN
jgi:RNA polymerase sigma factor (sigma-70 family)